jgi:hypothetical protein
MAKPVTAGFPFLVLVANKTTKDMLFVKWVGAQSRAPTNGDFIDFALQMMDAKAMKSMSEKIIKVNAPNNVFIAYRREDNLNVVFFVFAPLTYNKAEMRKLLRTLDENFRAAIEECGIDDDKLAGMGENALTTKSIVKKSIMAAVDKFADGVSTTDKILAQIEKNKALMAANIDSAQARNAALEDQVKLSETLVDLASAFADKAAAIKQAMLCKRIKMTILMCLTGICLLALIAWKLGLFE